MPAIASAPTSTDAYRRAARRLRCRFAGDPARLQQALKTLAAAPVAAPIEDRQGPRAVANRPARSAEFAEHVSASVTSSSVLRYSQRLQLIRDARRYGISRFEANLVIAAVLGRGPGAREQTAEPPDRSFVSGVTAFLIVQGALALGAWWTLFR